MSNWLTTDLLHGLNGLDQFVLMFSIPLIVFYFIFGLDDFFVDFLAWALECRPTQLSREELQEILSEKEKRIGILVASWKESGVLRKMVRGNSRIIRYRNYDFILGVYPNDLDTLAEAQELAEQYPNVRVVVNSLPGPTSKGQMLNEMIRAAQEDAEEYADVYDGYLIHDSEDIIHRYALSLVNAELNSADFIQVPIFSLPVEKTEFVAGTYIDEFSEYHTKDILLRHRLGVPIPSAGVGTALSSRLVAAYLAAQDGNLLNEKSLTEDYELGVSTSRYGLVSAFACHYFINEKGAVEYIATREYFPKSFSRSIRQKTRWTVGIAFQGFQHLGWHGGVFERYFLYRDRKGPYTHLLVASGWLFFFYCAYRGLSEPTFAQALSDSPLLYFGFAFNAFFMINRILQRMYCVSQVYGFSMAAVGIVRLPIVNLINAVAGFQAIQQYARSRLFGFTLTWVKTEHEMPAGFGVELETEVAGLVVAEEVGASDESKSA
jgi:adsorption protein B